MKTFLEIAKETCGHSPETPYKDFIKWCLNMSDTYKTDEKSQKALQEIIDVTNRKSKQYKAYVSLCKGTGCLAAGENKVYKKLMQILEEKGIKDDVCIIEAGCKGFCEMAPIIEVYPNEAFYCKVKEDDLEEIVNEHILNGNIVKKLLYAEDCENISDIPFYKVQEKRVLENTGYINPEEIDEAIAKGGYLGLTNAFEKKPDEVIQDVMDSGMRGRGGGGFPTGLKWKFCRDSKDEPKYLICNADEGDPGAFMDGSIMGGDPHRLIEGMIIAGYGIGVNKGFIYVRAEYPLAVERIRKAIGQAYEYGLLGKNILDSGFDFDLEVCLGAGAFVCGEETALMSSIEGKRGMPWVKPPYPAQRGLFGKPSNVNNVETFANVPLIFTKGVDWFASVGTEGSKGTKIFSLTGKIKNTGLVEVPMGIKLKDIIYDVGGGIINDKKFKAAQTGGPSGGCLPVSLLDVQIDFDSLKSAGAMMGSGGLVITDEETSMPEFAKFFLTFTQHESCGKCIPCREGTKRMLEILERITNGEGEEDDIDKLKLLGKVINETSACGLGQSSANPVLSTIRYFIDEYNSYIFDKKPPEGVVSENKNFIKFTILNTCKGCGACKKVCPEDCISGERKEKHVIDQSKCIKCGACLEKCPFDAIVKR